MGRDHAMGLIDIILAICDVGQLTDKYNSRIWYIDVPLVLVGILVFVAFIAWIRGQLL